MEIHLLRTPSAAEAVSATLAARVEPLGSIPPPSITLIEVNIVAGNHCRRVSA